PVQLRDQHRKPERPDHPRDPADRRRHRRELSSSFVLSSGGKAAGAGSREPVPAGLLRDAGTGTVDGGKASLCTPIVSAFPLPRPASPAPLSSPQMRFHFTTAGESHGKALLAVVEGLPAGLPVDAQSVDAELARRMQGYGRGARMKIESDAIEWLSGVRSGE